MNDRLTRLIAVTRNMLNLSAMDAGERRQGDGSAEPCGVQPGAELHLQKPEQAPLREIRACQREEGCCAEVTFGTCARCGVTA